MADERATLVVEGDKAAAEAVAAALTGAGVPSQTSGRRNLDGAAVTSWLVVAGLAVQAAPAALRALAEVVKQFRVGRIEIDIPAGKLVADNPRTGEIQSLLQQLGELSKPGDGGA
ncbi:MAG TPA: hypothetical protein VFB74_32945 [Kribbellaceae bacterium]|nr:hypothetical protein [Kribbellaceae bacterium]